MNVKALLNTAVKVGRKCAPVILLAAGTVLAVDAIVKTPEAYEESNEIIAQEQHDTGAELDPIDKVKLTWKSWMPVIWREAASVACFYGAFYIKHKRGAAIAALYSLVERERDELDIALKNALGNDKYEAFQHERMNKRIERRLANKSEDICVGPEEALAVYYEPISGKIFKADPRKINAAMEELDTEYQINGFVSLTDFFKKIGIDSTGSVGDYVGWQYIEGDPLHLPKLKTYDYHWAEKDIYITGLDMGLRIDRFVRTWW